MRITGCSPGRAHYTILQHLAAPGVALHGSSLPASAAVWARVVWAQVGLQGMLHVLSGEMACHLHRHGSASTQCV